MSTDFRQDIEGILDDISNGWDYRISDYATSDREEAKYERAKKRELKQATQSILDILDKARVEAKHEQRHQPLGVARWIAVGEEHGYWEHPMTKKKQHSLLKLYDKFMEINKSTSMDIPGEERLKELEKDN